LTHISMHSLLKDFLFENPGEEDALAIKKSLMNGENSPDNITNALLALRATRKDARELGACIDGYPMTEGQVSYLRDTLKTEPSLVILLECSDNFVTDMAEYVDPISGNTYTLEQAKTSNDSVLYSRIRQMYEEELETLHSCIENWELTKRALIKAYEQKVVSIDLEKQPESHIVQKIEFMLRSML
jgi:adenylate kinase family enzyme